MGLIFVDDKRDIYEWSVPEIEFLCGVQIKDGSKFFISGYKEEDL